MFSTQGFSGPSVQYAAVRISSILAKAGELKSPLVTPPAKFDDYDWATEHSLMLRVLDFPNLINTLCTTYELHHLATYLYDLTREFNRYYEQTPVLQSEPNALAARLWLLSLLRQVFATGLDVLGIEIPERM